MFLCASVKLNLSCTVYVASINNTCIKILFISTVWKYIACTLFPSSTKVVISAFINDYLHISFSSVICHHDIPLTFCISVIDSWKSHPFVVFAEKYFKITGFPVTQTKWFCTKFLLGFSCSISAISFLIFWIKMSLLRHVHVNFLTVKQLKYNNKAN